jgi:hypothetical protein
VLLGGFGFDNIGGERVFNRPRGVASDGAVSVGPVLAEAPGVRRRDALGR